MSISTSNITSILDTNKIKYNAKFKSFRQIAFTNESIQVYAEDTIEKLDEIVVKGVNGGFRDKKYIESVQTIIDCLINLGDKNAFKKFEKIKKEVETSMALTKRLEKNKIDVRDSVNVWLNTTLEGVEVLAKQFSGEVQKAALAKSKDVKFNCLRISSK